MIILMAGLPGTGKTTLARLLAQHFSGALLDKDIIRAALFSPLDIEYSVEQDDYVQQVMLETMRFILRKDSCRYVFLDGRTFSRSYQVESVLRAGRALEQPWRILHCICSDLAAQHRLTRQGDSADHLATNRDYSLYLQIKSRFEPITLPNTIIDSNQPLEICLQTALEALRLA
jgi:predicted kinase